MTQTKANPMTLAETKKRDKTLLAEARKLVSIDPEAAVAFTDEISSPILRASLTVRAANAMVNAWRLDRGRTLAERAVALDPGSVEGHLLLAAVLPLMGEHERAVLHARIAIELDPLKLSALVHLRSLDPGHPALKIDEHRVRHAVTGLADPIRAAVVAARILEFGWHFDAACDQLARYFGDPEVPQAQRRAVLELLARCHYQAGRVQHAVSLFRRALADWVEPTPPLLQQMARYVFDIGEFDELGRIVHLLEQERTELSEPSVLRIIAALARGEIGVAHREYTQSTITRDLDTLFGLSRRSRVPLRDSPRSARTLVLMSDGPGDEVRWASLFCRLSDLVPYLTLTCEVRFLSLFRRSFPQITFRPVGRWSYGFKQQVWLERDKAPSFKTARMLDNSTIEAASGFDRVLHFKELLAELVPGNGDFPRTPYLIADPQLVQAWACRTGSGRPRIALSWRSIAQSPARAPWSLTIDELSPLSELIDVDVWLYQANTTQQELAVCKAMFPRFHFAEDLDLKNDFDGMAAFLMNMDLVIAPCNGAGELAAGLGVQTLMFSNSMLHGWRRGPQGIDAWHATAEIIVGEPLGDRAALVRALVAAAKRKIEMLRS